MSQPYYLFCLLLLLFVFLNKSKADSGNTICPSSTCHGVNVSYPFWRLDGVVPTQYCGYPGFGLNCSVPESDHPVLQIHDDPFYVKNIDYEARTVTLVDIDGTTNPACPRARHNLTLGVLPLGYPASILNLTFYFNCSDPLPYGEPVNCLRSDESMTYMYVGEVEPGWFGYCNEKVVATVMNQGRGTGPSSMNDGFMLDWRTVEQCEDCEKSDGYCGFNFNDSPIESRRCFCSDGKVDLDRCKTGGGINVGRKVAIGLGAAAFSAIVVSLLFFMYHRRQKRARDGSSSLISRSIVSSYPSSMRDLEKSGIYNGARVFTYGELEEATNNFDSTKELGDGGFGTVYKGKLHDGRVVAVKRLYENNFKRVEQFMNEVEILTRLRHPNLVALYGFTSRHCRELLLVYEYISNGTVADHLHGHRARPGSLSWTTRMSIAIETASALVFLHASDVIHRDVKTNNILLDDNFCVKVADFGLSRLFPNNVTHVSTAPQGTPGYVDPEYHECYQLTDKSDVYSFGVVLIELISSLPAVDITRHRHEINLSNMAINKIHNNQLHELVDPNLGFDVDYKVSVGISAVAELAFQCLQIGRDMRPSMEEVLEMLKGIQKTDSSNAKAEEMEIPPDEFVLLKSNPLSLSPE